MEISKGLQEEIIAVQNKLKNAIRDHQICVGKLKDDPDNPDILGQIQQIQLHIVSLGRCQKQIVQRLRKEVEAFKAENANGAKVSIATLLGLNNNNHITNNNEAKRNESESNGLDAKRSKDDYEEDVVRNGDVSSPTRDLVHSKGRPSSVETVSGEDDVIEVSVDENSCEKQEDTTEDWKAESEEKLTFLTGLGLITTLRYSELQNKRAERKRRSTANPQFVYTSLEMPTKRKRYSYLQSTGNAPQTRQSTARMNGPSPPPTKVSPPKSTSPPTKAMSAKALISLQKSTTRPNILRNVGENKVLVSKGKLENGGGQVQLSNAKSVQPVSSKAVHIPGLPSSLTIERIENDSVVCINCRNPGTLTVCENCSANYHVSCHSISPAPPRICPKCALKDSEDTLTVKREEELEEKERERYELRERNSDLRLQVYELEKRSQLLGQSLQLQQRSQQELLGKQEKTQRSIKRLVDFIKLMQLRRSTSSPRHSGSDSYHPQRSSSQSPRTPSPQQPSTSRDVSPNLSLPVVICGQKLTCPTVLSSSVNCQNRVSPIPNRSPRCPTPTSSTATYMVNQKNITNHISSSKSCQSQEESSSQSDSTTKPEVRPRVWDFPQFSTANNQAQSTNTTPVSFGVFPTSSTAATPPCSSTDESPSQALAVVRRCQNVPCPPSTGYSIALVSPSQQPTVSWNNRPSTVESPKSNSSNHGRCSVSRSDHPAPRIFSCRLTTSLASQQTTVSRSQSNPCPRSPQRRASADAAGTGQRAQVYSTHCSQAITSPIPSPSVFANHRETVQTETPASQQAVCVGNGTPSLPAGWKQASSQTSPRTTFSEVLSAGSSNT